MLLTGRYLLLQGAPAVGAFTLSGVVVAGPQVNLAWDGSSISGEAGFSIERRDVTAGGSFAEIDTVGPSVSVYAGDVGPFTEGHRYAYRVVVVGGPSDGETSNTVTKRPVPTPAGVRRTMIRIGIRIGL